MSLISTAELNEANPFEFVHLSGQLDRAGFPCVRPQPGDVASLPGSMAPAASRDGLTACAGSGQPRGLGRDTSQIDNKIYIFLWNLFVKYCACNKT
jgi:hypothetical protein